LTDADSWLDILHEYERQPQLLSFHSRVETGMCTAAAAAG
jgi:hypothetical protein